MKLEQMNRYQAFGTHLLISLVIFAVILVCITQYWYPGILFDTGNGWKAIGLIIGIDLILGPLLTLLVFNPKKSSLKFDLSVIAAVQIAALSYGTWTIYSTHPVALAFVNSHFITLYANSELGKEMANELDLKANNRFFYDFDSTPEAQSLEIKGFKPYSENQHKVLTADNPHFHRDKEVGKLYIQIDPFTSATRNIILNATTGEIIGYQNSSPLSEPEHKTANEG